jgi:hypothetical protein
MYLAGKDRISIATWQDGLLPLLALPGSPPWLPQAEATLAQVGGGTTHAVLPLAQEVALPSTARQG